MTNLQLDSNSISENSQKIVDHTQKTLGFIPNMYAKMAHNTALLDVYTYAYNSFRANSGFNSIEQEVIFLSVALENQCNYCMAAHSFIADNMSKVPVEVTNAIRDHKEISDTKLAALSKLTRLLTVNRGKVDQAAIDHFLAAGYSDSHVLGIVAGIAVKTLSNYSNHLTHPEVDAAFKARKSDK